MTRKGCPNKTTKAIKERIEQAFKHVNGKRNAGLIKLSKDHPAIFYGLVAKCVPTAVAIDVQHHIDLGALMLEAERNLQRLAAPTIDVTPSQVVEPEPVTLTVDHVESVACDVVQPEPMAVVPGAGDEHERISRRKRKA